MEIDYGDSHKEDTMINKPEEENVENVANDILLSDVPAQEWQREVEKVSSKLKSDFLANHAIGEWRGHIDQIKTYDTVSLWFNQIFIL